MGQYPYIKLRAQLPPPRFSWSGAAFERVIPPYLPLLIAANDLDPYRW